MASDRSNPIYEQWGAWFDRCSNKISLDSKIRWMLANSKPSMWSEVFSESPFSKSEVKRLLAIGQKRTDHLNNIERLRGIIEKILNFKSSGDIAKDGLQLQKFKSDLAILPEGLLKQFGQLLLARESKNGSALKRLMEEVIHWEYRVIPFYGVDIPLSNETWVSVDKLLVNATKAIDDSVLLRAFASRVFQFIDPAKLPDFSEKMDVNWSLNELREYSSSAWYAPRYPAFWFWQTTGRVAQSETGALVDSLLSKLPAKEWNVHDLWIFGEWFPAKEELRADITLAVKNLAIKKDLYLDELVVRLAENVIVRRELEKSGVLSTKALFKLKRDYYQNLLTDGAHVDYALYQLIAMGDEDKSYLWWLALSPFRIN